VNQAVPSVLYIMGAARTGSTILEVLLANSEQVFGAGEAHFFFRDYLEDRSCSCGRSARDCAVWPRVVEGAGWSEEQLGAAARLFERIGWHTRFAAVFFGLFDQQEMERFRTANRELFGRLAALSGCPTVVDSSKYAARALALAQSMPDELRVIWLVRAPEGLLSSFMKKDLDEQPTQGAARALAYYFYAMTCQRLTAARLGPRVLQLRYEDLQADPQAALTRIERWAGLDLERSRQMLERDERFDVGHITTGNRLRNQGRVRFRPSLRPAAAKGAAGRLAVLAMRGVQRALGA